MFRINLNLTIAAFILLCFQAFSQIKVDITTFYKLEQSDTIGYATIVTKHDDYHINSSNFGDMYVKLAYPVIKKLPDMGTVSVLNSFLENNFRSEFYSYKQMLNDNSALPYHFIYFNVLLNSRGILSILMQKDSWIADGASSFSGLNLDANSGMRFQLSSLIDSTSFQKLTKTIVDAIRIDKNREGSAIVFLSEEQISEFSISDKTVFYLTKEKIHFILSNNPSPGTLGGLDVALDLREIKKVFVKQSALNKLIN